MRLSEKGVARWRRTQPTRAPWTSRKPDPPREKGRRWQIGATVYARMSDGSVRNLTGERRDRRELGLSGRQFRKAKRAAREEAKRAEPRTAIGVE